MCLLLLLGSPSDWTGARIVFIEMCLFMLAEGKEGPHSSYLQDENKIKIDQVLLKTRLESHDNNHLEDLTTLLALSLLINKGFPG